MESENYCESNFISHEEEYQSYDIYIEKNPDPYRGGFMWSVGNESEGVETGLSFTLGSAVEDARKLVDEKAKNKEPTKRRTFDISQKAH